MTERIIIRGGTVMDPSQKLNKQTDVLIENGKILALTKIPESGEQDADQIIDAKGLWVLPGLVDMHVHFREPGHEGKETLATGSRSREVRTGGSNRHTGSDVSDRRSCHLARARLQNSPHDPRRRSDRSRFALPHRL